MPAIGNAWPRGSDPGELRRAVAAAHERFLASGRPPARLRDVVRDSWQRCRVLGVDPETARPPLELSGDRLEEYRGAHPFSSVLPLIRRLLVDAADHGSHIVAVGDAAGRLLWVEGERGLRARAERMLFVEGANWAEAGAGTNAPALALALGHEAQVFASEHFSRNVQSWSCSAAPVRDPDTGAVIGVLDLTGADTAASPYALALVRAAAAAVEGELRLLRLAGALAPASPAAGTDPAPLRVLGRDGALFGGDGHAVELGVRHAEILLLLAHHPGGLTAEGLGARLHERDVAAVTVRAEVARLRRLLGPGVLASRPYRLSVPVRTDIEEVRRLLALGRHRQALGVYQGPVLPASTAPGVVDIREELAWEIRTALGRDADAESLLEWARRPDGRDDPRVLDAALRALPEGSPHVPLLRAWLRRGAC
ncbi:GAF domain-containing protein [Marinactinospora thermotolerans]|uniref:GAF domain-containing protein n=1 Tax=Marinactinospora thermotolerans TaxID=531310 RepID=UPI003D949C1F